MKEKSKHRHLFAIISILAISGLSTYAAPLPKDFSRDQVKKRGVTVSPTYDFARSTWRATKIKVKGKASETALKAVLKNGVILFEGDKPRTAPNVKSNLNKFKVSDGILSFVTKTKGEFYWKDPIPAAGVPPAAFISTRCAIRIKQSLPSSKWRVLNGVKSWITPSERGPAFELKGTKWQTWWISAKIYPLGLRSNYSFGLKTQTPGNRIQIKWVKFGFPSVVSHFRKSFELTNNPEDAKICLAKHDSIKVYINGVLVKEALEKNSQTPTGHLVRLDGLAKYFKKGGNVIAVAMDSFDNPRYADFFLEGMVRMSNGKVVLIKSDDSWKGSFQVVTGWKGLDFDDTKWRSCAALGLPIGSFGGKTRKGLYLNPPYYGPIELKNPELPYFIYSNEKPLEMDLTVYPDNFAKKYDLRWDLENAETSKIVRKGVLATKWDPKAVFTKRVSIDGLKPGVYDFHVKLIIGGKVAATRVEELALVGKIQQREVIGTSYEEGLDLELEDEIDLTDPKSPYQVFSFDAKGASVESPIRSTKLGRYRESAKVAYSMFGVAVEHQRIYEPYLVEIDYPDDQPRIMSVRTVEMTRKDSVVSNDRKGRRGWNISAPGAYSGFDQAISGEWKKLRFVIFPKNYITGFMFTNNHPGLRAAAAKIRIYRIKNGLPALKIPSPSHRLTGIHSEDIRIFAITFAGEDGLRFCADTSVVPHRGFLKQWYATFANMIQYMRFCGENLSVAGVYMYTPDNRQIWPTRKEANAIELMGRMFAANDLKVMLGVEFARARPAKFGHEVSDEQLAKGAWSKKVVSKHGEQMHTGCGDMDNIYEESVQKGFYDVISGICDTWADTPGIAGIALQEGKNWSPGAIYGRRRKASFSLLDNGYGDATIAAFERDSGIEVPVQDKDPNRFMKRYDFLMSEQREAWIQWRNNSTYEINRKIGEMVVNANPNWRTYIFPIIGGVKEYVQDGTSPLDMMRLSSFDPRPYKKDDNVFFGGYYQRRIRYFQKPDYYLDMRQWSNDPRVLDYMDDATCFLHDGFYESLQSYPDKWYFQNTLAGDYVCPVERNYLKSFATIMSHATPRVLAQVWIDCNMMSGHEQERREMNRVFQVIPLGKYRNMTGETFNPNLAIRSCENNSGTAFYVVNTTRWPLDCAVTIADAAAKVRDLALGSDMTMKNGEMPFELKPFETKVFQIKPSGRWLKRLLSSQPALSVSRAKIAESAHPQAAKFAAEKVELYKLCLSLSDDILKKALKALRLMISVPEMREMAEKIVKSGENGDFLTIAKLTEPYPIMVWDKFLKKRLEANGKALHLKGFRINVGSKKSCEDQEGNTWLADQLWLDGVRSWGVTGTGGGIVCKKGLLESKKVKCPEIFKSERFGIEGYRFQLPNGRYQLKLYFTEYWAKREGERLFDIAIQGDMVSKKLDVFKKAGGSALPLVLSFPVEVKDGLLKIDFKVHENNSMLNGIEVTLLD